MKFTLTVDMDNAAFAAHGDLELARILADVARFLDTFGLKPNNELPLVDMDGNTVGFAIIKGEEK